MALYGCLAQHVSSAVRWVLLLRWSPRWPIAEGSLKAFFAFWSHLVSRNSALQSGWWAKRHAKPAACACRTFIMLRRVDAATRRQELREMCLSNTRSMNWWCYKCPSTRSAHVPCAYTLAKWMRLRYTQAAPQRQVRFSALACCHFSPVLLLQPRPALPHTHLEVDMKGDADPIWRRSCSRCLQNSARRSPSGQQSATREQSTVDSHLQDERDTVSQLCIEQHA